MRVLFSTTAGAGHFGPLVPFARACRDAGHDVRVAAPASFAASVTAAGFAHVPFADVPADIMGAVFARLPTLSFEEANQTVMVEVFGRLDAQAALAGVTAAIAQWRPDIVVREPCEFASLVAAERAGVAQVQVAIGLDAELRSALPMLDRPLDELGAIAGLAPGRAGELMAQAPQFTSVPLTLDAVGHVELSMDPAPRDVWRFGDVWSLTPAGALPPAWGRSSDPLVYVSFGSVTAGLPHLASLYSDTLTALSDSPVRVLMTTGAADDVTGLAAPPVNARVESWWHQADVMAHAAAVVGHGGFGTTMLAIAAGVPQVIVPLFAADQTVNGRCVAARGAAIHLSGGPDAVADIPDALGRILSDPAYRTAARALAAEIAALPATATAVAILEGFAASDRPRPTASA